MYIESLHIRRIAYNDIDAIDSCAKVKIGAESNSCPFPSVFVNVATVKSISDLIFIALQQALHAQRDIVIANPFVSLSVSLSLQMYLCL